MRLFLFMVLGSLLISCSNNVQTGDIIRYSAAKENGFRGKVKTVTTFNYTELQHLDGKWQPIADSAWGSKKVLEFDTAGNIILETTTSKNKDERDPFSILFIKHSYHNNVHTANQYGTQGDLLFTIKYDWIDKMSYSITARDVNGEIAFQSKSLLNNRFRDRAGDFIVNENKSKLPSYKYENTLDSNGRFIKVVRNYIKPEKREEVYFNYKNFDREENATFTTMTYANSTKPWRIAIRTFEYYQ